MTLAASGILPFGVGAWTLIVAYLTALIGIGWWSYRRRIASDLTDFYLAGRGFGFVVLLLTLYATQYSGNTLVGYTGKAYRVGFGWILSLHFMTAIVVGYLLLAPKLHARAHRRGYITPADYLDDRFGDTRLTVLASLVMIVSLLNYLLSQLVAMGKAVEGFTGAESADVYLVGVVGLALVIVVYESLGGLRAVAWTDVLQGTVLFVGFVILLILVLREFGSLPETTRLIVESDELRLKAMPPDAAGVREWLSYIFVVGIGASLYPQAVQRIFAAREPRVLQRSLAVMAFLPLVTTTIVVVVGVTAIPRMADLEGASADRVLTSMCRAIQEASTLGYWLVVVLFAALLAAIMSTADSALLSISSMITGDLFRRFSRLELGERQLTRFGKVASWVLLGMLVAIAVPARDSTLIKIIDRKFDVLVQLAPAFFVGLHWRRLTGSGAFWGLVTGLLVSIALPIGGYSKLFDVHPGLYGLPINLLVALTISTLRPRSDACSRRSR